MLMLVLKETLEVFPKTTGVPEDNIPSYFPIVKPPTLAKLFIFSPL